jgi:hypothetical protein
MVSNAKLRGKGQEKDKEIMIGTTIGKKVDQSEKKFAVRLKSFFL